jgi:hypothetical protein
MEHSEYLYLLLRAQEIQKMSRRAAEEGEEFFPADTFTPLSSGLEAQAVLRPIQPNGTDALILRLRHRDDGVDRTDLVRRTQHIFFPGTYTVVPAVIRERGWCEYLAYAEPAPEIPGELRTS